MLEKLRENPRAVVATLISAGVISLAVGSNGTPNNPADTSQTEETVVSLSSEDSAMSKHDTTTDGVEIGSEPVSGPVDVNKEDSSYSATVRNGDNQTVVARQMTNDYLSGQSQSLSAEQRLYVETVVVDSLPRNDVIHVGDVIEVDESVIAEAVAASGELTHAQIAAWSAYL